MLWNTALSLRTTCIILTLLILSQSDFAFIYKIIYVIEFVFDICEVFDLLVLTEVTVLYIAGFMRLYA
jgi:hypothetical protein